MYTSTRSNINVSSTEAILKGLAADGGLYVFKTVDASFFEERLVDLTYHDLAKEVLFSLLTDYTKGEINDIVNRSYHTNFPQDVVRMKHMDKLSYLELYHGNTFAFKDMALSMLPQLFSKAKEKNNMTKKTIILTATSGDTGSAALDGFSQLEDTYVIVLYPTKGVSEFQEKQMNDYQSDHHIVLAVDGNFDDCQRIAKEVFTTVTPKNVLLSSANSINIGRIIPQVIYYVHSYLELVRVGKITYGEKINITVPTGNFGNIYASYIAMKLGVPINKFIIASNQNNVLTDLFNKGKYISNRNLLQSISPSMDILVSSNVERYLFDVFNQDRNRVLETMSDLKENGTVNIHELLNDQLFYADFATEEETKQQLFDVFKQTNYLIDPHTAVASYVATKYVKETNDQTYMLVVSTANPYKFSDAVIDALKIPMPNTLKEKMHAIHAYTNMPIDTRMKRLLECEQEKIDVKKEGVYNYLKKVIGDIDDQNNNASNKR